MAKLTKTQRADLERTLRAAKLANDFIQQDRVLVCTKDTTGKPYRTDQFYNEDLDLNITPTEKAYGSYLCQLPDVVTYLESFLKNN